MFCIEVLLGRSQPRSCRCSLATAASFCNGRTEELQGDHPDGQPDAFHLWPFVENVCWSQSHCAAFERLGQRQQGAREASRAGRAWAASCWHCGFLCGRNGGFCRLGAGEDTRVPMLCKQMGPRTVPRRDETDTSGSRGNSLQSKPQRIRNHQEAEALAGEDRADTPCKGAREEVGCSQETSQGPTWDTTGHVGLHKQSEQIPPARQEDTDEIYKGIQSPGHPCCPSLSSQSCS